MPALLPHPDPDGLLEYSVVYTDRSLNHMSMRFCGVMTDISRIVKSVYRAQAAIIVPGSGTFGMEAVARQFATDQKCLILRNGWFSFRWSQILEMGRIASGSTVLKARRATPGSQAPFAPAPLDEVIRAIKTERRPLCSRRMWKPRPALFCRMSTCARSEPPSGRLGDCSSWIASPPEPCGSTCKPITSTC